MPFIEKHAPGTFCWIELGTTDQPTAKHFYHTLFGWTACDVVIGPNSVYSRFQLEGCDVGGAYTLRHEQQSKGVQPHWMLYIAVDSADEAASSAASLGGSILTAPSDVLDEGRMAVLQDPSGAVFSVWQARSHAGTGVGGVDGTLCWADLITPDPARAREFYSALFGWKLVMSETESSGYLHISSGEEVIGGIPPAQNRDPNIRPYWLGYFAVSDCDKAAATAMRNEATSCVPPVTLDNVGRLAVITDPEGAVFAVFRALPRATTS